MAKNKESITSKVAKSEEYVVDDSTSDENSDSAPTPKAARKKSKAKSESSSEVDSDTSASEDSSSDASTTSSASSQSAGTKRRSEHTESIAKPVSKKQKTNSINRSNTTKEYYKPPTGYDPIDLDAADFVSETSSMFSNLDGKQVWHITVPASVPVTSIETLDIQAALRGEPIFTHKGISYNMFAAAPTGEALLLPRGTNSAYAPAKVEVSRNFHLREVPNVKDSFAATDSPSSKNTTNGTSEHLDTTNYQFFARETGSKKVPRKQPSGLLMRYTPYGGNSDKHSNKPYTLTHPDTDEAEQPTNTPPRNQLVVPMMEESDDDKEVTSSKAHKSAKKDKKSNKKSASNGISHEDPMDVDASQEVDSNVASTPRSKAKSSNSITNGVPPESERKKKKKERKEKA